MRVGMERRIAGEGDKEIEEPDKFTRGHLSDPGALLSFFLYLFHNIYQQRG